MGDFFVDLSFYTFVYFCNIVIYLTVLFYCFDFFRAHSPQNSIFIEYFSYILSSYTSGRSFSINITSSSFRTFTKSS